MSRVATTAMRRSTAWRLSSRARRAPGHQRQPPALPRRTPAGVSHRRRRPRPPRSQPAPAGHRDAFVRIVIEKPFGHDRASAEELDELVHRVFDESQVYRIDHYLGKESVQNVLALRFANTHLRADLEPQVRRRGGDHRGRGRRRGPPRQLLRADRGVAGHRAEPRHADPCADADGTAGDDASRRRPRREGEGVALGRGV